MNEVVGMYGLTRSEELRIEVGAMCSEVERIEKAWCATRCELDVDDRCLALGDRLRALHRELAVLQASLDR